jgi:hypothetical protein
MKAPTKTEAQAMDQAAKEANRDAFYKAKSEVDFCNQVVKLATFAAAMKRRLNALDTVMDLLPHDAQRIRSVCTEFASDWKELDQNSLHVALESASYRIADAMESMETAFVAAERGHHAQ